MAAKLYNLARMSTATTGTGTVTLGAAVSGFLTFSAAGVQNGDVVSYGIKDGGNSEVGTGTYTASGTTLTRTVVKSTNADAAISLSGNAEVFITALKADIERTAAEIANTPAGSIAATNVQAALNELDTEKAHLAANNTFTGGTQTIDATGSAEFVLDKNASGNRAAIRGRTNGINRWVIDLGASNAETGSDTGSSFQIVRCNDAGGEIAAVMIANRGSNTVSFQGAVTATEFAPSGGIRPLTNGAGSLGAATFGWAALHGNTGFTWNIANGNWAMTHSSGKVIISPGVLEFSGTASQYSAKISARVNGPALEWGHTNTAGYGSSIGAEDNSGRPFVALHAGNGTVTANTYRTFGLKGMVIRSDLSGGLQFLSIPIANADNQAGTVVAAITETGAITSGNVAVASTASPAFTGTPTAPTASPGTNTAQIATTAFVRQEIAAIPASARFVRNSVDGTSSSTTYSDVSGLSVTLAAGTYGFRFSGYVTGNLAPGLRMRMNYTGTVTAYRASWCFIDEASLDSMTGTDTTITNDLMITGPGYNPLKVTWEGVVSVSTGGGLTVQLARQSGSGTVTLEENSVLEVFALA